MFQSLVVSLASTLASRGTSEGSSFSEASLAADSAELGAKLSKGASVEAALLELGSVLGERLVLGQTHHLAAVDGGVVAGYAHPKHAGAAAGTGRMAALVSLRASPSGADLTGIASQLARHIVALQP